MFVCVAYLRWYIFEYMSPLCVFLCPFAFVHDFVDHGVSVVSVLPVFLLVSLSVSLFFVVSMYVSMSLCMCVCVSICASL